MRRLKKSVTVSALFTASDPLWRHQRDSILSLFLAMVETEDLQRGCLDARRSRETNQMHQQQMVVRRRLSSSSPPKTEMDADGHVDLRKLAVCTTVYSLVEGAITYPYDLVKTRQQMARPGTRVAQMPTTAYVHEVIQTHGAQSLYRGFSWNVLGGVPSEVAYYATYTQAKTSIQRTKLGEQYPSAVFAIAGLLSDVVGVFFWVPADVISQRMQLQDAAPSATKKMVPPASAAGDLAASASSLEQRRKRLVLLRGLTLTGTGPTAKTGQDATTLSMEARASSAAAAVEPPPSGMQLASQIFRTEGVLGLWRGTAATMLSLAPNSAVWWLTHEEAKPRIARRSKRNEEDASVLAASGALAGTTSTLATNPLDVVKTRIQCAEEPGLAARGVLRSVLDSSGWRGLYAGLIPRLAAAIPRSICAVLAYEKAIALCRMPPEEKG